MSVAISASDVKKLRDITGAGMMDCKKALAESGGDIDKAIEFLRKRGQKMATKRADRDAKEGVVLALVSDDHKRGVIVKLSSETDFVAKNEKFIELAESFATLALEKLPESVDALLGLDYNGITVADKIAEQVGVIGEKIELAAYEKLEAAQVAPYIHMGNKAGVLVGLSKDNDEFFDAGRDVAMQVAAMHPIAVDKDGVDTKTMEKEIEIGKEQARAEGKPDALLEKIAMGKLNKFYKEKTLLNQQFVKDSSFNVGSFLKSKDKDLTVTDFKHVTLG
ncbi:MAG: elongation factor Ts [Saprospiraceae bacterium]|nr:MAG: elongation factor Ts [Saprospiraceae bacterium]